MRTRSKLILNVGKNASFLILPILYLYLSFLLKSETGPYHLFITDPEYAYLLNGLGLCQLGFPYHVQGPGTPPQLFCALVIEIVHLFRLQHPLVEDVMRNPDLYLSFIHGGLTVVISILLFFLGVVAGKYSKTVFAGLFLQLMLFTSWQTVDFMRRFMVENVIIAGVIALTIVMFIYLYRNPPDKRILHKFIILFSLVIGLIAATKLMYLPIAIIPFLIIPGFKNKALYVLYSIIAFSLMAFPIFNRWSAFWDWHVVNFLHSGQYGQGAATIIDLSAFKNNLHTLFRIDGTLRNIFCALLMGSVLYHLPFLRVKIKDDKEYSALIGIIICMAVMTFLVSKQLKYYYMITAILLEVPGVFLLFRIFTRPLQSYIKILVILPFAGYLIYMFYGETMVNYSLHDQRIEHRENYMEVMRYVESAFPKDQPTLVIPDYYGAPYKEYGIFFGLGWCSPKMGSKYAGTLDKLYPYVHIHHGWNNMFNQWSHSYSYIELMKKYKKIVLYVGDENLEKSLDTKLNGLNRQLDTKRKFIRSFPKARATFYYVYLDTAKNTQPYTFLFNLETLDSTGQFYLTAEGFPAQGGSTRSSEHAFSGKYSCKLVNENPFGITCALSEVQKGDHYTISVWKYQNENTKAGLVISTLNTDKFYIVKSSPSIVKNGWQKIEYKLEITDNLVNEDIKIYLWNMEENAPAYFDDLSIERKYKIN